MHRSEYMDGDWSGDDWREKMNAAHRAYYGQYVDDRVNALVVRGIGLDALKASTDPHFNDIPLRCWDALNGPLWTAALAAALKANGDWAGPCAATCILKEAARQLAGRV